MALVKAGPSLLTNMRRDIDRVFDRFFEAPLADAPTVESAWIPTLDFTETDDQYMIRVEVPDIPKENLDVRLEGDTVTVSGHRETHQERKGERYIWREREEGKFARSVRLPSPVKQGKVDAHCENGILTVKLPKQEPTKENKILIK